MLKPVSILALDDAAATLADAVQQRVAALCGLEDLVQWRTPGPDLGATLASIHARRQAPDSPLRLRDDISNRELVLVIASASGTSRTKVLDFAREVRQLYAMRRFAEYFSIDILCLLPEVAATTTAAEYGAAYSLLKLLTASGAERPFETAWLLDATNASRVTLGPLAQSLDAYADAVAASLVLEPELSGAPATHHPRGMDPLFATFGFAELVFDRDVALQRLEPRFVEELLQKKLLAAGATLHPQLAAKQFITGDEFAAPLARIGAEAGRSVFKRFRPKNVVGDDTRSADELIVAVRVELKAFRDGVQMQNLQALATRSAETSATLATLLARVVDETLDRNGYEAAIALIEALLDADPASRVDAAVSPRTLMTEIATATALLDSRLRFVPGSEQEDNDAARGGARDAEALRLAGETFGHEQQLRELFAERPRIEQALRELLEERREFLWRQVSWGAFGLAVLYGLPFAFGVLRAYLDTINGVAAVTMGAFVLQSAMRYLKDIAPRIRAAREAQRRIREQIVITDETKNAAHNDELQFESDVAHRSATLAVLRRIRDAAVERLTALRVRLRELTELAQTKALPSIVSGKLSIAVVDDEDVDAWYERTRPDRELVIRDFFEQCVSRAQSLRLPLAEVRERIFAQVAVALAPFRTMTLAKAAEVAAEGKLAQRLRRFGEAGSPMIELRDEDPPAQQVMQRDATLWIDATDAAFATLVRRRLADAQLKPPVDPLRAQLLTRVLHYPAYVLGQIEYYRAQYDPSACPESSSLPDVMPAELILTGPIRAAYEQVLLGRAFGMIHLRDDGRLARTTGEVFAGRSHLDAAEWLMSSEGVAVRHELDVLLARRLTIAEDVDEGLNALLAMPLDALDRSMIAGLRKKHGVIV